MWALVSDNERGYGPRFLRKKVPVVKISDDHHLLAFVIDTVGDESYTLIFRDLRSRRYFGHTSEVRAMTFGRENRVFFTTMDTDRRASAVKPTNIREEGWKTIYYVGDGRGDTCGLPERRGDPHLS